MTNRDPRAVSGEDRLIARHFRPLVWHPGAFGLADDAALLNAPEGCDFVITADALVGGVHFFPDDHPGAIARKALRVNLSDLAAKGAQPAGFLLVLALPDGLGDDWLKTFSQGLGVDSESYSCPLLGGDTVKTPGPLMVSITAFGTVPRGAMVARRGAKVGDRVLVTGTIGDGALGLAVRREPGGAKWGLDEAARRHLLLRYLLPEPRNACAAAVRAHASAAMDVSDGLAGDLAKLCRASGVTADIEVARVPLSDAARAALAADPALIGTILAGGDDYEIVATVPATHLEAFRAEATIAGVPVTDIGRVVAAGDAPPRFIKPGGEPLVLDQVSFSHF